MLDMQELIGQVMQERYSHLQATLVTDDITSNASTRDVTWDDAILIYGDYSTHLSARFGTTTALGIKHEWREMALRNSADNAQNEGFLYSALTEESVLPGLVSNTCQIFAGKVGASKSLLAEAARGRYGEDLRDFLGRQADMAYKGILKDTDRAFIRGVQSTSDPRAMKGLAGAIGTWDGFLQTNKTSCGGDTFEEDDLKGGMLKAWNATNGEFVPNAAYISADIAQLMADWTDKVKFLIDIQDPRAMTEVKAGVAVGWYQSQFGVLELFLHPEVAHSNTPAHNFAMLLYEPHIRRAVHRDLAPDQPAKVGDKVEQVIVGEHTLEVKCEKSSVLLHNFTK